MAKEYAYYVTGNLINIFEKDEDTGLFQSPSSNITSGARITSKVVPRITDGTTHAVTNDLGIPDKDKI